MSLRLRNPHSVLAALKKRPQDVSEIILPAQALQKAQSKGEAQAPADPGDAWAQVAQLAQKHRIPVRQNAQTSKSTASPDARSKAPHKGKPSSKSPPSSPSSSKEEGGRVGAAEAGVKERKSLSVEELFKGARERKEGKGLWLALDCLQDPHNVGAIFRTAAFFGVEGILLTQERSAPLSSTVYDVASGGMEYVPFTLQINLQRAFEVAKEAGLWILGTSEHAKDDLSAIQRDRPWLLVLGNEEKGLRRLTEESCDLLCQIRPKGGVGSLNVSVAAGIAISRLG